VNQSSFPIKHSFSSSVYLNLTLEPSYNIHNNISYSLNNDNFLSSHDILYHSHPSATIDDVCDTVWVIFIITVHPQPVMDHFPLFRYGVLGYHSECSLLEEFYRSSTYHWNQQGVWIYYHRHQCNTLCSYVCTANTLCSYVCAALVCNYLHIGM